MSTPTPEITALQHEVKRLEQMVRTMAARVVALEREVQRVRSANLRTVDQLGSVERRMPR